MRGGPGEGAAAAPAGSAAPAPATERAEVPAAEGAAAGATGPAADVLARHPHGVPVAIYLMPSAADRASWAQALTNKTVAEATRLTGPARGSARARRAFAAMAAAGRTHTTGADAEALAAAKFGNDLEFSRQAPGHAAARGSVAANGGSLQMGQAMPFTRQEPDRWKQNIKAVSDAVGPLPAAPGAAPVAAPAPAAAETEAAPGRHHRPPIMANHHNINEIAVFTHGGSGSIDLGSWIGVGQIAPFLASAVTASVNVQLYACNAGADGGLAQQLAEQLSASTGGSANVFGHETAAHTTNNAMGRSFRAEGGRVTLNATNYDAIFSAEYLATEATRLEAELGCSATDIQAVLAEAARRWLNGPGRMTGIDIRGSRAAAPVAGEHRARGAAPTQVSAAQSMGVDFEGTLTLVRHAWQRGAAGFVRRAMEGGGRRGGGRSRSGRARGGRAAPAAEAT